MKAFTSLKNLWDGKRSNEDYEAVEICLKALRIIVDKKVYPRMLITYMSSYRNDVRFYNANMLLCVCKRFVKMFKSLINNQIIS